MAERAEHSTTPLVEHGAPMSLHGLEGACLSDFYKCIADQLPLNDMWARLDDELIDHSKIFAAGEAIGKNGPAIALGFYAVGLMWSNKHLTDGVLPAAVIKSFRHVDNPLSIADALAKAGLWDKNGSGFVIHDFGDFNPKATKVKAKRRRDKERKQRERDAKDREEEGRL